MAEYIVQGESLTAIADEIRELSGTTNAMGLDAMAGNVSEANEEVSNQVDLIAQITSALEGKAAGGQNKNTITIEVTPNTNTVYYFDENKTEQTISNSISPIIVEALNGVVMYRQAVTTNCTGKYVYKSYSGWHTYIFLEDGGTMICADANSGGGA